MDICAGTRSSARTRPGLTVLAATLALSFGPSLLAFSPLRAQQPERPSTNWTMPRTPAGHPDLQGNWTNATVTPIQRPEGQGPVFTREEVARIEGRVLESRAEGYADSDPDREAPPVGGVFTGNARFDAATGGTGGYNAFYIDAGERVAIFNGEPRTSLIVDPPDGRVPELSEEGRERVTERRRLAQRFGAYDNPENRPLGERCIMSFGSNAGPTCDCSFAFCCGECGCMFDSPISR